MRASEVYVSCLGKLITLASLTVFFIGNASYPGIL